ncbi:MAG TPA: hypothetical protein VEB22_04260, partial [Phycisphaerales bacterium]|nr:hypothetical protein [Phycisphaerales bacterium]
MHRFLTAASALPFAIVQFAAGQVGLTELGTVNLGEPVQGTLPGTVIADISNQCGVCAEGVFFVVDLAGPGFVPGVNSAHIVLRRWSDPVGAHPVVYCPLAPPGFLGMRASLVYDVIATNGGELVVFCAHRPPLQQQPVQCLIQVQNGSGGPRPRVVYREG